MAAIRRLAIVRRWSDAFFLGIGAATVVLFGIWWAFRFLSAHVSLWALGASIVCCLAFLLSNAFPRSLAAFGLRHISTFPSPWGATLLGVGLVSAVLAWAPLPLTGYLLQPDTYHLFGAVATFSLSSLGLLGVHAVVMLTCARKRAATDAQNLILPLTTINVPLDFAVLCEWLKDDAPIVSRVRDLFGHARIADRMTVRLLQPEPPAQALVGRLGSGKSTIREMVRAQLKEHCDVRPVEIVEVELWPYETSQAAVQGVIQALISGLGRKVNVVGLRGLPNAYAEAMTAVGGVWSALARLQGVRGSPLEILRRIDAIAAAIGVRYVVWVEDLERFAAGRPLSDGEAERQEDSERLGPIRALLASLDSLDFVTVVTATTTLHMRFDLEKIARFVEEVPDLDERCVLGLLGQFRRGCRCRADIIDPALGDARNDLDSIDNLERLQIRRALHGSQIRELADALPVLCRTPRTLKQALRRCLDTWNELEGEIDFDDLLVMSLVRDAAPDAFVLIRCHAELFQRTTGAPAADLSAGDQSIAENWNAVASKLLLNEAMRAAVAQAVQFVFGEQSRRLKPQGLGSGGFTNYWQRFLAVPKLTEEERDQPVLRILIGKDDNKLLDLLENPRRHAIVFGFSHLLTTPRIRALLSPLVVRRASENQGTWRDGSPPGLIFLGKLWLGRVEDLSSDPDTVTAELRQAIEIAIASRLAAASAIERHFVLGSENTRDLFGGDTARREELKGFLRSRLMAKYAGRPDALATALDGSPSPTLLWLCWGLDRVRGKDLKGLPFEGWPMFAPTLLDAAVRHPGVMLGQVAHLIVNESAVVGEIIEHRYVFDTELAVRLFGDLEQVMRVARAASTVSNPSPIVRALSSVGLGSRPPD